MCNYLAIVIVFVGTLMMKILPMRMHEQSH